jgi:ribonuclease P protein component
VRNRPLATIKKKNDFKHVFSRGKSVAGPLFVIYAVANGQEINRLGLSVSKKVGNAVVRNRIKRWVKEALRVQISISVGYDFIVIARVPAGELPKEGSFAKVGASLAQLFKRLGVMHDVKNLACINKIL